MKVLMSHIVGFILIIASCGRQPDFVESKSVTIEKERTIDLVIDSSFNANLSSILKNYIDTLAEIENSANYEWIIVLTFYNENNLSFLDIQATETFPEPIDEERECKGMVIFHNHPVVVFDYKESQFDWIYNSKILKNKDDDFKKTPTEYNNSFMLTQRWKYKIENRELILEKIWKG